MPLVILKTLTGKPRETLEKTMKQMNALVAENLGYDPSHCWVMYEEIKHDDFVTDGKTWTELKPILYGDK